MPGNPNLNSENPPRPQPIAPPPSGGAFIAPSAYPQPMIDTTTGAIIQPPNPIPPSGQ